MLTAGSLHFTFSIGRSHFVLSEPRSLNTTWDRNISHGDVHHHADGGGDCRLRPDQGYGQGGSHPIVLVRREQHLRDPAFMGDPAEAQETVPEDAYAEYPDHGHGEHRDQKVQLVEEDVAVGTGHGHDEHEEGEVDDDRPYCGRSFSLRMGREMIIGSSIIRAT